MTDQPTSTEEDDFTNAIPIKPDLTINALRTNPIFFFIIQAIYFDCTIYNSL